MTPRTDIRPLFDAVLVHQFDMGPLTTDGEGELIGSGDGVVQGPSLSGTLRWTLFEHPGRLVCSMNPVIVLETNDGAAIRIRGRGYARRHNDVSSRWRVAATLEFETDDAGYAWLDGSLGFWEGEFVADEGRASYRAYTSALPRVSGEEETPRAEDVLPANPLRTNHEA